MIYFYLGRKLLKVVPFVLLAVVLLGAILLAGCTDPEAVGTPPPPTAFPAGATPGPQPETWEPVGVAQPSALDKFLDGLITIILIAAVLVVLGLLGVAAFKLLTNKSFQRWLNNEDTANPVEAQAEAEGERHAMEAEESSLIPIAREETAEVDTKINRLNQTLAVIGVRRGAATEHLKTAEHLSEDLLSVITLVAVRISALEDHGERLIRLREALRGGDRDAAMEAAGTTGRNDLITLVTHDERNIYTPQLSEALSAQIGFTTGQVRTLKRIVGGWVKSLGAMNVAIERMRDELQLSEAVDPFVGVQAQISAAEHKLNISVDEIEQYTQAHMVPQVSVSPRLAIEAAEEVWRQAK